MNEQIIDGMTMTDIRDYIESWLDEAEPKLDRIEDLGQRMAERIAQLQAENERLRVELDDLKQQHADLRACHDEHYAGMLAAMAENERLRALVTEITMQYDSMPHSVDPMPNLDISIDQRVGALVTVYMVQCHRLAQIRAALGEGG